MTDQPAFEEELKIYMKSRNIPFQDHCASMNSLDFHLFYSNNDFLFSFDAKEKKQKYNLNHWPATDVPEEQLFIIDDLAARKIVKDAPLSGMLIRDNLKDKYYFFSVVDLMLMPKMRVNRPINKNIETRKGKWLIDLRNGASSDDLEGSFERIREYILSFEDIFSNKLDCYGSYIGENIESGGIVRKPEHWEIDNLTTH